jgi:GNAT superfamily N-acetyltransferase
MNWGAITEQQAAVSIERSLDFAVIYDDEQLVAMGRVIGDGALFFYLQDVVVHPDYQHKGLGAAVMQSIEQYLQREAKAGATVALLAAEGREGCYEQFGYQQRTGQPLGLGMCKFIS